MLKILRYRFNNRLPTSSNIQQDLMDRYSMYVAILEKTIAGPQVAKMTDGAASPSFGDVAKSSSGSEYVKICEPHSGNTRHKHILFVCVCICIHDRS